MPIVDNAKLDSEIASELGDVWTLGGHTFQSRLLMGSGRFESLEVMQASLIASECQLVTFAVRRERLHDGGGRNLLDFLDPGRFVLIPNTSGCYDAESAVRSARMGREILRNLGCTICDLVKLEVLADSLTLLPDPIGTFEASARLVAEGFTVMCYTSDDPILARRLFDLGVASVMPAGSPIGSGLGILNPKSVRTIVEDLKSRDGHFPVIVDAGIGTASDAAEAMELGVDGVLLNTAVAKSQYPETMAIAMKHAIFAGRQAFLAKRPQKSDFATSSSPEIGVIGSGTAKKKG